VCTRLLRQTSVHFEQHLPFGPAGFLRLQVTLFRTISSGKFMDIYNTFAAGPLLIDTINFLTAMLQTPASQADKVRTQSYLHAAYILLKSVHCSLHCVVHWSNATARPGY
jgi:hypothetical protein